LGKVSKIKDLEDLSDEMYKKSVAKRKQHKKRFIVTVSAMIGLWIL
jgi:hypothetical protein